VLPTAEDEPSVSSELFVNSSIALSVGGELWPPILNIRFRSSTVNFASVPEASIDKDRDSPTCEDCVRTDQQAASTDPNVLAKSKAPSVERRADSQLGLCVDASVTSTHRRRCARGRDRVRRSRPCPRPTIRPSRLDRLISPSLCQPGLLVETTRAKVRHPLATLRPCQVVE